MPDPQPFHERELDDRIRDLIGRAVADAPAPPEITPIAVSDDTRRRGRRPWFIVGTSLLGAAAAAIAVVVVNVDGQDTIGPADTSPGAVTTTTTIPAASQPTARIAVTDGAAVAIADATGDPVSTIAQPWTIALPVGDGRVVGQERSGPGYGEWDTVATTPYIWNPDGTVARLFPTVGERSIILHDVAVVDSIPWLLYSVNNGDPTPEGQAEELHAVSLDGRGEVLAIGQIGAWEAGTHRLHLAANGLIVGESFSEANSSLLVLALPGSPAERWSDGLVPAALGIEDSYHDCADTCPTAYTVDDSGTHLAWIQGREMAVVTLTDGIPGAATRIAIAADTELVVDLDLIAGDGSSYLTSYFQATDAAVRPPQLVTADGTVRPLDGATATWGPAGVGTATPPATPTTSTAAPTTTSASTPGNDPADEPLTVVASGPNGIARIVPSQSPQPEMFGITGTAIAFDLGADGVLYQEVSGWTDGVPPARTAPVLATADGSAATWSVAAVDADETSTWALQDVVEFDGAWWVVYSRQAEGRVVAELPDRDVHEITDHLFAAPLAGGTPTDLGQIGGWENGTSRVHAAPNGVLVASWSASVTTEWWTASLPGAEASAPIPAELGIEASTSECQDCPRLFGWTDDGNAVTWMEGTIVVIHPIDGRAERRIDVTLHVAAVGGYVHELDVGTGPDGSVVIGIDLFRPDDEPSATATAVVVDAAGAITPLPIDPTTASVTVS